MQLGFDYIRFELRETLNKFTLVLIIFKRLLNTLNFV